MRRSRYLWSGGAGLEGRWDDGVLDSGARVDRLVGGAGFARGDGGARASARRWLGEPGAAPQPSAWLGRRGRAIQFGLAGVGRPPDYAPRGGLYVLWRRGRLLTARRLPYPGLARLWRQAGRRSMSVGRTVARLVAPLVRQVHRRVRELMDRGEAVNREMLRRRGGDRGAWRRIFQVRRDALSLKRHLDPLLELLERLDSLGPWQEGDPGRSLLEVLQRELRDADRTLASLREAMNSTTEAYASIQANRLAHTMQALTVISLVFLPATLIASIYGMNFYIPEVHWPWGYAYSLGLMAAATAALLLFARARGWLD